MIGRVIHDETGANLAEYGLLAVLIAIVAILAVIATGKETSSMYSEIATNLAG